MKFKASAFTATNGQPAEGALRNREADALADALLSELEANQARLAITGMPQASDSAWSIIIEIAYANLLGRAAGLDELATRTGIACRQVHRHLCVMSEDGLVALSGNGSATTATLTLASASRLADYFTLTSQAWR